MGKLNWYIKKGFVILEEPNKAIAESFIAKAETAVEQMRKAVNKQWEVEAAYYAIYHAAYSILVGIGIKCEMHDGTFAIMKELLEKYFTKEEVSFISKAHRARNNLQYYTNKVVAEDVLSEIISEPLNWIVKCKDILSKITEKDINEIRNNLQKCKSSYWNTPRKSEERK